MQFDETFDVGADTETSYIEAGSPWESARATLGADGAVRLSLPRLEHVGTAVRQWVIDWERGRQGK